MVGWFHAGKPMDRFVGVTYCFWSPLKKCIIRWYWTRTHIVFPYIYVYLLSCWSKIRDDTGFSENWANWVPQIDCWFTTLPSYPTGQNCNRRLFLHDSLRSNFAHLCARFFAEMLRSHGPSREVPELTPKMERACREAGPTWGWLIFMGAGR